MSRKRAPGCPHWPLIRRPQRRRLEQQDVVIIGKISMMSALTWSPCATVFGRPSANTKHGFMLGWSSDDAIGDRFGGNPKQLNCPAEMSCVPWEHRGPDRLPATGPSNAMMVLDLRHPAGAACRRSASDSDQSGLLPVRTSSSPIARLMMSALSNRSWNVASGKTPILPSQSSRAALAAEVLADDPGRERFAVFGRSQQRKTLDIGEPAVARLLEGKMLQIAIVLADQIDMAVAGRMHNHR